MSGPYDNNYYQGSQYPQQGYGGYSQQQQGYDQGYNQNYNQGYPPQQSYGQQDFGPPRRRDSYGPPMAGGFQHGQYGQQYGAYDASNPQGHAGYYSGGGMDAYQQNQAYQTSLSQQGQGQQQQQYGAQPDPSQLSKQSSDPNAPNYDPNAPPMSESDRGLLGAMGGGWAGHHYGKKQNHGFLGMIGGAIAGSMAEDYAKKQSHKHKHNHHNGQSTWGGGNRW